MKKERKELEEELADIAPFLSKMKEKPSGHVVPTHYFNNMRIDVMQQLKEEMPSVLQEKRKTITWWSQATAFFKQNILQPRLAIGFASLVFLLGVGIYFINVSQSILATDCNNLACVPEAEINQYLEENIADMDEELMWEAAFEAEKDNAEAILEKNIVPILPKKSIEKENIKVLNDAEIDGLLDEMLKNNELSEEELSEIL